MATSVLIIGGGPGGYVAAIRAAQLGGDVTLIEKEHLGGTCLNVGCIPTKALLHSAELYVSALHGEKAGIIANPILDFAKVQANKAAITKKLVNGVSSLLKANGVKLVKGEAVFSSKSTVTVGEDTYTADKFIIATGSVPSMPPIPGLAGARCIDSTGALALDKVPKNLAIIGGGVIGAELATIYSAFKTRVTVIEMLPEILPMIDPELVEIVKKRLKKTGVEFLTDAKVLSIENGADNATVFVEKEGNTISTDAEYVLSCIGRRPYTGTLQPEAIGIRMERGAILVNERMETSLPGVYAIGDCTGGTMLAHVASAQGEVAAENALGHSVKYDESTNPSCVYTNPELAVVGMDEAALQAKGIAYKTGRFPLAANGKALIMNGGEGMVKVLAGERYGQILGVGIVGARATDLIAEAALAIRLEATIDELVSTIHAHPSMGEAVREAALAAENRAIHNINK